MCNLSHFQTRDFDSITSRLIRRAYPQTRDSMGWEINRTDSVFNSTRTIRDHGPGLLEIEFLYAREEYPIDFVLIRFQDSTRAFFLLISLSTPRRKRKEKKEEVIDDGLESYCVKSKTPRPSTLKSSRSAPISRPLSNNIDPARSSGRIYRLHANTGEEYAQVPSILLL